MLKKIILLTGIVLLSGVAYGVNYLRDVGAIASGYVSQTLCTNVVMLGRDQAEVEARDLSMQQHDISTSTVKNGMVETVVRLGPLTFTNRSVYRPGLGCSAVAGRDLDEVLALGLSGEGLDGPSEAGNLDANWPAVNRSTAGVDYAALDDAVGRAFTETTDDVYRAQNTRAVLVHHKGELIAERYGEGFDGDTPLRGMSMTKSASATVVGILVGQGRLDIHEPAPVRGWSELSDARSRVTTHHL